MKTDTLSLDPAFEFLRSYDRGSDRGALVPIDEAVRRSLQDPDLRIALERRLGLVLSQPGSVVAREYVCSKLTLIGTDTSVPALAALLSDPELATPARTALEAIPGNRPDKAFRKALGHTKGLARSGVINSLGNRRDSGAVASLRKLLADSDVETVRAAVSALGRIGSAEAAKCLMRHFPLAGKSLRPLFVDALLVCADQLRSANDRAESEKILRLLEGNSACTVQNHC